MNLSAQQQQIVDLISTNEQQVVFFEFNTSQPFTEIYLRLEVYEYGQLTDTGLGFAMVNIDSPLSGNIAAVITEDRYNGHFHWQVTLREGDPSGWGSTSSSATIPVPEGMMGRGFGPMHEAVHIDGNTEAVLFASRFTSDGKLSTSGSLQDYLDPANFAGYPIVHVLIATFTK